MEFLSRKAIILLVIFSVMITTFINPVCGDSTGPDRTPDSNDSRSIFDRYPVWSEVHNLIAYAQIRPPDSSGNDTLGIYVVKPDGSEKRMIYQYGDVFVAGLDWSNDGNWLITNAGNRLIRISFHTGDADTLTQQGEFWYPVFSHDGNSIAFAIHAGDTRGIYIMSVDGTHTRRVIPYGLFVDWPYPDSLLYLNFDQGLPIGAICMANTGGNIRRVVYQTGDNFDYSTPTPKMHTSTGRIIFHAQEPGEARSIWILEPQSEQPSQLMTYAKHSNFSPDGNKIVFTNIRLGDGKLWLINWDGTGLVQLTY